MKRFFFNYIQYGKNMLKLKTLNFNYFFENNSLNVPIDFPFFFATLT